MPEQEKTETSSNNLSLISAITGKVDDAPHAGPSASAGASDAALGPGAPGTLMPSSVPREAGFAPLPSPAPTVPVVEGAFAPPFGYPAPVAPAQTGYSPAPQLVAKAATAQTFNVNLQKNFSFSRYAKMESNLSWLKIIAILLVTLTHSMQSG